MLPIRHEIMRSVLLRILSLLFLLSSGAIAQIASTLESDTPPVGSAPYRKALEIYKKSKNFPPKILNGVDAHYKDFPWQVALVRSDISDNFYAQFCGGVLLGEGWVATAAHCVDSGMKGSMLRVVIGTDILKQDEHREEVDDDILIAPNYDSKYYRNDVAIMRLKVARPSAWIPILTMAEDTLTSANPPEVTVVGWGYLYEWGLKSRQLKQIKLALPTMMECKATYKNLISPDMFCAGKKANGKDACKGDSGGAVVVTSDKGTPLLAGLVSWSWRNQCGKPNHYGVYARLSRFQDWIQQQTHLMTKAEP